MPSFSKRQTLWPINKMKTTTIFSIFLFVSIVTQSQIIELSTLLNISTEKRMDNAIGHGLSYSQKLSKNNSIALGFFYKYNHAKYSRVMTPDADPNILEYTKINSKSKCILLRLNYQHYILNREQAKISFGPEISYNYFWGVDNNQSCLTGDSTLSAPKTYQNTGIHKFGFGILTKFEINEIIIKKLSLIINIRPEFLISSFYYGSPVAYSGIIGNVEFSIGLQYKLK